MIRFNEIQKSLKNFCNRKPYDYCIVDNFFDTTQNSWHGMSKKLNVPKGIYRKSLAVYYLTKPSNKSQNNQKAIYAPRDNQKNDKEVLDLIKIRQDPKKFSSAYKK